MHKSFALSGAGALAAALLAVLVRGQAYQQSNLTPDGYWHNRYHMLLSMAAYGNYNSTCPLVFTEETLHANFPNSTRAPWQLISEFGPTLSGCRGFTGIVAEMNKALIIFAGDYALERSLPDDVVTWDEVGLAAEEPCGSCTVNRFAVQAYLECKNETNNFEAIREAYYGQGLVFSIGGHGLGGMLSQIAAVDFYAQNIDYYNHAYGSPMVFNQEGAIYYNDRFNGEAGEYGLYNNDQMGNSLSGHNYTMAGTPFYYHGWNETAQQPFWTVCWLTDFLTVNTTDCNPRVWDDTATTTALEDHYFYMSNVGECAQSQTANTTLIDAFVANASASLELPTLDNLTYLESFGQSMATSILDSMSSVSAATSSSSASSVAHAPAATTAPTQSASSGAGSVSSSALLLAAAFGASALVL